MSSPSSVIYGPAAENLFKGDIPDLSDVGTVIKMALLKDAYTPDQDHDNWGQVSEHECDDDDYTDEGGAGEGVGGQEITDKKVDYATRVTTFDTDMTPKEVVFTEDGEITARYAVIYYAHATPASAKLLTLLDFGEEKSSADGEFKITIHADGILKFTVTAL